MSIVFFIMIGCAIIGAIVSIALWRINMHKESTKDKSYFDDHPRF